MDGRSTEVRHSGELEPLGNEDVIQQEELPSQGTIKDIQGASRVASKKAVVASSCGLGIRKDWKLRLFVRILDLDEILCHLRRVTIITAARRPLQFAKLG